MRLLGWEVTPVVTCPAAAAEILIAFLDELLTQNFTLPSLPYAYSALQPIIDEQVTSTESGYSGKANAFHFAPGPQPVERHRLSSAADGIGCLTSALSERCIKKRHLPLASTSFHWLCPPLLTSAPVAPVAPVGVPRTVKIYEISDPTPSCIIRGRNRP
jgi:hypothetical protein